MSHVRLSVLSEPRILIKHCSVRHNNHLSGFSEIATSHFVNVTDAIFKYGKYFYHFFTYVIILKQLFTSGLSANTHRQSLRLQQIIVK